MRDIYPSYEGIPLYCNGNKGGLGMYPRNFIKLLVYRSHDHHAILKRDYSLVLWDSCAKTGYLDGIEYETLLCVYGVLFDPGYVFKRVDPMKDKLVALGNGQRLQHVPAFLFHKNQCQVFVSQKEEQCPRHEGEDNT